MSSCLIILGAGASVDSGMGTYRGKFDEDGKEKYYKFDEDNIQNNPMHVSALKDPERRKDMWNHIRKIAEDVEKANIGPTYIKLQELCGKYDKIFILTQNIDGLIFKVDLPNAEIGVCKLQQEEDIEI